MRKWLTVDWTSAQTTHQLLLLTEDYDYASILNPCRGQGWGKPLLAGLGAIAIHPVQDRASLIGLQDFIDHHTDHIFGHFGYNLKAFTEHIPCRFPETDGFEKAVFFVPEIVVIAEGTQVKIGYHTEEELSRFQERFQRAVPENKSVLPANFIERTPRKEYISKAREILAHIHRGDIYEMNFCVEFFAERAVIDPVSTYQQLSAITRAPYCGLYKNGASWLLCGSPELYLRKNGDHLESQPIKGTRKRGQTPEEDERLRTELRNDQKEQSENIMIVDLVRNDLSRVAEKGSVKVTELFGITSFETVHQMSSTIACTLKPATGISDIIRASFPMGSMTGAPKISAMKIAEEQEAQSRGIYSGSIGYITPEKDFEFNVVIRSITWNEHTGHLSIKAGSALTAACDPGREYEECLLKSEAMMKALQDSR